LNEFENTIFGPDFSCDYECFRPWVESRVPFLLNRLRRGSHGRSSVLSVASVLVTDAESRDRMMRGEITDTVLQPWRTNGGVEAVAYLSVRRQREPIHLAAIYDSLAGDIESFRRRVA